MKGRFDTEVECRSHALRNKICDTIKKEDGSWTTKKTIDILKPEQMTGGTHGIKIQKE
jgi:hypothetical protein